MTTMKTAERFEAMQTVCARRKRSWAVQPEAQVGIARPALNRAYRMAVKRGEITRSGIRVGTPCSCGCGKPVPPEGVR